MSIKKFPIRAFLLSAAALMMGFSTMAQSAQASTNNPLLMEYKATPMQNETLDFDLMNETGYNIGGLYLSPTSEQNWGPNILPENLASGSGVHISFAPEASATKWDLRADWLAEENDGEPGYVYWIGLNLDQITTLTLYYDEASGKTSATAE